MVDFVFVVIKDTLILDHIMHIWMYEMLYFLYLL